MYSIHISICVEQKELKRMVRSEGIPVQQRGDVWRMLIRSRVGRTRAGLGDDYYRVLEQHLTDHKVTALVELEHSTCSTVLYNTILEYSDAAGVQQPARAAARARPPAHNAHEHPLRFAQLCRRMRCSALSERINLYCTLYSAVQ